MQKIWFDEAWNDYLYWQTQDKKTLKRLNTIIKDTERQPFAGIGKPEPLKGELSGFWSRRIDACNRFVYRINSFSGCHFSGSLFPFKLQNFMCFITAKKRGISSFSYLITQSFLYRMYNFIAFNMT